MPAGGPKAAGVGTAGSGGGVAEARLRGVTTARTRPDPPQLAYAAPQSEPAQPDAHGDLADGQVRGLEEYQGTLESLSAQVRDGRHPMHLLEDAQEVVRRESRGRGQLGQGQLAPEVGEHV